MQNNIIKYKIVNIKKEVDDVFTLSLFSGALLSSYIAGQVVTIFFPDINKNKGKEYSVSSAPSEKGVNITVKRVGVFSKLITDKKVGDILLGSLPFGYFYTESTETEMVFIAGGIGVVPFRSMIVESLKINPNRKIDLFYSNKFLSGVVFKDELDVLANKYKNIFKTHYYLTKETVDLENIKSGRIPINDILEKSKSGKVDFFICGSMDFVQSYHKLLYLGGVSESSIFTEEFF